jgi:hypothetical protein
MQRSCSIAEAAPNLRCRATASTSQLARGKWRWWFARAAGWQDGAGTRVPISAAAVARAECDAEHIGSLDAAQPARAHQDVCSSCHTAHHEGRLTIRGTATRWR